MNTINIIMRAASERRILSTLNRRLDPAREWKVRASLRQQHVSEGNLPSVQFHGDFEASAASMVLKRSLDAAQQGHSALPEKIRNIEGMSGQTIVPRNPRWPIHSFWLGWHSVRVGTLRGLKDAKYDVEASIEIRTIRNNTHATIEGKASEWHNGNFLAVIRWG